MYPNFYHARLMACMILGVLKHFAEATEEAKKAVELSGRSPISLSYLGWSYALAGMEEEAREIIGELSEMAKTRYASALWIAAIYAGLNDKDRVFDWLDKAYEERFEVLTFINISPFFYPVRDDPRFDELLEKVGLSDFD